MNSKGQLLYAIFVLIVFGIIWVAGLASLVNTIGEASGATGLWGFVVSNLNMIIGFCYIMAWAVALKYG